LAPPKFPYPEELGSCRLAGRRGLDRSGEGGGGLSVRLVFDVAGLRKESGELRYGDESAIGQDRCDQPPAGFRLLNRVLSLAPTRADAPYKRFQLILIKPSHYDDDGYVIQCLRSAMPSNSLAVLYGLAADAANRGVLGANVAIDVVAIDETNQRVRTDAVIRRIKRHGGFGMVGLVGVQSNEFPRAVDIAAPLRRAGIDVVIGGFHVSGCLSMLRELPPDIQAALDMGITIFAGEAEGQLDGLLLDAANGRLKPIYNYMADLPNLASATTPYLPPEFIKRVIGNVTSFDGL
jgi:hypothetical protein